MSKNAPMFMAIHNVTVRISPSSSNSYCHLEFMRPAEYQPDSGLKICEAEHFRIWINEEKIKELADLLYAQLSMKFIEGAKS